MGKILVTQVKSSIGAQKKNRKVLESMGLKRIGHMKEFTDNNCIRGMLNKVAHLVKVELREG